MSFIFRGKHANRFMTVNSIERGLLPPQRATLLRTTGKLGAHYFGSEGDVVTYNIKGTITANTILEREAKLDAIKVWLSGKEGELIFDWKNAVSYQAVLDGDTPINHIGTSAEFQFTLLCADPVGTGLRRATGIGRGKMTVDIDNKGTAPAYPSVRVILDEDAHQFSVIGRDKSVTVGQTPDFGKTTLPYEERILYDELIDTNLWHKATSIDDGKITADFTSNGYQFEVKDYGKGGGWHGASAYRSLKEPIENFMVELHCTFVSGDRRDMGRVGFYFLDENGKQFGKAHLNDVTWMKHQQIATCKFGGNADGTGWVYDRGAFDGVWNDWKYGIIRYGRKKRNGYDTWFTYFAIQDTKTGRYHTELYREYADYARHWTNRKLAGVQIEASALGDGDHRYFMSLNHINVFKYNEGNRDLYNDKPFKAGDFVEIDMESASVYHNGVLANELLDPSSDFFSIPAGKSQLAIYPPSIGETFIYYNEKYM
ncbi:distal tail protein Dit [Bacillus pacificus]|uniref:distal tail protein Dit n=1 Tax=Bacillus pacificus TaxID=2026187 RepID=UPI00398FDE84